jgi:hypothetical protein
VLQQYVRAADHRCCPTTTYPDYIHTIHPNLTPPAQTRAKAYIFVVMPTTVSVNRGAQAAPTGEKPARSERKRPPASLNKAVPVRLLRLHHHLARTSRRCSRSHHSATTRTHRDTRLLKLVSATAGGAFRPVGEHSASRCEFAAQRQSTHNAEPGIGAQPRHPISVPLAHHPRPHVNETRESASHSTTRLQ